MKDTIQSLIVVILLIHGGAVNARNPEQWYIWLPCVMIGGFFVGYKFRKN